MDLRYGLVYGFVSSLNNTRIDSVSGHIMPQAYLEVQPWSHPNGEIRANNLAVLEEVARELPA